jgi:hypothetical protein
MRHHGSSMRHPDHLKTTLPGRVRVRSDYRRKMTQYTDVTKLASSSPAGRAPARVREYGAPPRATGLVEAGTRGIVYMGTCRTKRTPDRDRRPRHFTLYRIRRSFHHRARRPDRTTVPRGPRSLSPSVHAPPPSSRVHINQESSMYESKTVRASPWLAASPRRPRPCEAALQPRRRLCQALPALPYVLLASLGGAPCYR